MNSLFQQWNKLFTDDMVFNGPGYVLGFGSMSPLVTNFSIDPVMTRNPSYKQIIKICFGLNGKLHNRINVNTGLTKIKMQLMQRRLQLTIQFIMIWFDFAVCCADALNVSIVGQIKDYL